MCWYCRFIEWGLICWDWCWYNGWYNQSINGVIVAVVVVCGCCVVVDSLVERMCVLQNKTK